MAYVGNKVNLSCFDLMKQVPDLKTVCPWLKETNSQSLQQSIANLDTAFTRFFKGYGNFPVFKKKSNKGSFNIPQSATIENNKLIIPKFKEGILITLHRPIKGTIRQAIISRTPTGKYFASILCETGEPLPSKPSIKPSTTIGIDLGLKSFLVTSDGQKFDNPRFLRKAEAKLKFIQRKYSLYKGKRTSHKLASIHEKVANKRKDFLHKTSTKLIRENQSLAIEDLNIVGMAKNHTLAKSISDVGWGEFVRQLEYKAEWFGCNILLIGRFEPSSKLCSNCGTINKELTLQDREWTCRGCNSLLDRDINAAINIKSFALKNYTKKSSVERRPKLGKMLPTLVGALTSEIRSL